MRSIIESNRDPISGLNPLRTMPPVATEPSIMFKSPSLNATGYYRTQHSVLNPLRTMPPVTTEPSTAFKSSSHKATGYYRTQHCLREISRGLAIWFKDFPHNTSGYYRARHCLRGMCGGLASGTKELLKISRTTPPATTEPGIVYAGCAEARPLAQQSF